MTERVKQMLVALNHNDWDRLSRCVDAMPTRDLDSAIASLKQLEFASVPRARVATLLSKLYAELHLRGTDNGA